MSLSTLVVLVALTKKRVLSALNIFQFSLSHPSYVSSYNSQESIAILFIILSQDTPTDSLNMFYSFIGLFISGECIGVLAILMHCYPIISLNRILVILYVPLEHTVATLIMNLLIPDLRIVLQKDFVTS